MKQYITWKGKPVEWGVEHPNTHDQDKTISGDTINFIQTPYTFIDGRNLAYIEYDENIVTQQNLIDYGLLEPAFELTIISELDANIALGLNYKGLVGVLNFTFIDDRPVDIIPLI